MEIPFTKLHGLGNNYIYVDCFKTKLDEESLSDLAIEVSDTNFGIGSDGLILLLPSEVADVKMRVFNKDGSEAKNCGNGLRCIAKLAYDKGYVTQKEFSIETLAGIVHAEVNLGSTHTVEEVTVNMGEPILERSQIPMVTKEGNENDHVINESFIIDGKEYYITAVSMGNPHVVFFVDDIKKAPVDTLGSKVEKDQRFPDGVNVEFVEAVNKNELNFRVWERGSGITQACGTGACAATVASVLNGLVNKGEEITVHLDGGDLNITWTESGDVLMKGPAVKVASGTYFYQKH